MKNQCSQTDILSDVENARKKLHTNTTWSILNIIEKITLTPYKGDGMRELQGYIIVESVNQKEDVFYLASGLVFFNRADAEQKRSGDEVLLKVKIELPSHP